MALRDTSWVWDTTTGSPKTSNAILVSETTGIEKQSLGSETVSRSILNTTYEWVGVTKAAALAFDSKIAADSTNTTKTASISEQNRIVGAYNVTMVVNSTGGWS